MLRTLVCCAWIASLVLLPAGLAAQPLLPVLDPARLPHGDAAVRQQYESFLLSNLPRAFALSADGKLGWQSRAATPQATRDAAIASCQRKGGQGCAIYAEDLAVVWPGRVAAPPPPPPPAALLSGPGWEFAADPHFIWWGPQKARGVYVFAHGRNPNAVDARGIQPQAHVRAYNNAGFDVVRFDRDPNADDKDRAAGWLRDGLRALRQQGWRMVVAGGQSRGGWNSLQILDTAGAADVVIAVAPATSGISASTQASLGHAELYRIFTAAASPRARVAIVQFADDPYEQNPAKRADMARELLAPRVAHLLLLDQPPGITGHGGGATFAFTQRYAACLLRFGIHPQPPSTC